MLVSDHKYPIDSKDNFVFALTLSVFRHYFIESFGICINVKLRAVDRGFFVLRFFLSRLSGSGQKYRGKGRERPADVML